MVFLSKAKKRLENFLIGNYLINILSFAKKFAKKTFFQDKTFEKIDVCKLNYNKFSVLINFLNITRFCCKFCILLEFTAAGKAGKSSFCIRNSLVLFNELPSRIRLAKNMIKIILKNYHKV